MSVAELVAHACGVMPMDVLARPVSASREPQIFACSLSVRRSGSTRVSGQPAPATAGGGAPALRRSAKWCSTRPVARLTAWTVPASTSAAVGAALRRGVKASTMLPTATRSRERNVLFRGSPPVIAMRGVR